MFSSSVRLVSSSDLSGHTSKYPGPFHNVSADQLRAVKVAKLRCTGSFGQMCFMHVRRSDVPGEGSLTAHHRAADREQRPPVFFQASATLSIQGTVIPEWAGEHPVITVIIRYNTFQFILDTEKAGIYKETQVHGCPR